MRVPATAATVHSLIGASPVRWLGLGLELGEP